MIEPKELRVGNYLESGGVAIPIDAAHLSDLLLSEYYALAHNPIPITPEWLERLGFLPYPFNGGWRHESSYLEIDSIGDYFQYQHGCAEIRYIHQLQNLFHSITGQELTIKQ